MKTNVCYQGDCLEVMKGIPDKSVDMILADLPYGTTACKWDTIIPFEPLWEQYKRIIKDRGAIVLFGSEPFSSHLRMSNIKQYKYDWVWDKVKLTIELSLSNPPNKPLKKDLKSPVKRPIKPLPILPMKLAAKLAPLVIF